MKINTKYSLGDFVYPIHFTQKEYREKCKACDGAGTVTLKDDSVILCPKCQRGYEATGYLIKFHPKQWYIGNGECRVLTIGEVRFSITNEREEEEYMCEETGIGGGTIHKVERLFSTKEDAEAECNKRNAEAKND